MGFLSDIVRDSRPRPARAPRGGGADTRLLPLAEPLGMLEGFGGGPSLERISEPTLDSPAGPPPVRSLRQPTSRERAADSPGDQAPGYGSAPAEAGGVAESPHRVPSPSSPIEAEGELERPEGWAEEPAEPRGLGEEAGREVLEGAEGAVVSRASDSLEGPHRVRSFQGPTTRDRAADSPGDQARGDGSGPAEAGGVGRAPTDASPFHMTESLTSPPAVEGVHGQRRRGAGIEPRAPARGPEDPTAPASPEGAEDGEVESAGPESRERATEEPSEPRSVVAQETVEHRAGDSPADLHRVRSFHDSTIRDQSTDSPENLDRVRSFDDSAIRNRGADSPRAQALGYGGTPAEAGGVGDVATNASPALRAESSASPPAIEASPPAVEGVHSQRRRRAGMEPRTSARGPEGPVTPPSALTHQPTTGSPGIRDPASQEAAQAPRETPREAGVPGTVARPLGLPESPPWLPRGRGVSRSKEPPRRETPLDSPPSRGLTAAAPQSAEGSGSGEGEIPVVEAVARPASPPRPLPALRGGEAGDGPGTRQRPRHEPEGPRVHIGQVDVLVQAPSEPRRASKPERKPTGLTSRLYLRRL
jgi:hypothetical protein